MLSVVDLWLPILASSVLVFLASWVIHVVLPIHKADFRAIPNEDAFLAAVRSQNLQPGGYVFPHCECMKDMGSPAMIEKYRQGPVGILTVIPSGPPAMGKSLLQWFIYTVVIGVFAAYLASRGLARGEEFLKVFQITGTAAILGHAATHIPDSIWKGQPWTSTLKFVGDGIVYGLLTGLAFGWLWPGASA